jgi:hypothetical protein
MVRDRNQRGRVAHWQSTLRIISILRVQILPLNLQFWERVNVKKPTPSAFFKVCFQFSSYGYGCLCNIEINGWCQACRGRRFADFKGTAHILNCH